MSQLDEVGLARVAADPQSLARLEHLLMRYPALEPEETDEVGDLLSTTGPLDMGLLSRNQMAWSKAETYRREHPQRFRASWASRLFWFAVVVATIVSVILMWDAGVK